MATDLTSCFRECATVYASKKSEEAGFKTDSGKRANDTLIKNYCRFFEFYKQIGNKY